MPLDQLPKTFRDAVFVTRYLGVSLIWIDALAIIQDSEEDWKQESVKMGDVYLNPIFTIAVHSAEDDSEGFLAAALQKREAVIQHLRGQPVGIYKPPNPATDVTQSGLAKRGWVLQERMLASRTLHFTWGQVYMEDFSDITCEHGKLSEISKLKIVGSEGSAYSFLNRFAGSSILSPSELPELRQLFHQRRDLVKGFMNFRKSIEWLNLIEIYSRCDLTKDTDRLMAITGIARKIFVATSTTWCAGIWSQFICKGLLWLLTKTGLVRPSTVKAPSWSWAFWEGPIQYPRSFQSPTPIFQERCCFVSVSSQNGEPTTWLNTPGFIVLQGRLLSLAKVRFQRQQLLGPGVFKGSPSTGLGSMTHISLAYHVDAHGLFADGMLIGRAIFDTPVPTSSGSTFNWANSAIAYSFANTSNYEFAFLILRELKAVSDSSFLGICLRRSLHSQGPYTRVAFAEMNDRFFSTDSRIATTIDVKRCFSAAWDPEASRYCAPSWDELLFDEADMTKVTIK